MNATLSIAVPTYGRDRVLIDTLRYLLALDPPPAEILVLDQTPAHAAEVAIVLREWDAAGAIRWLCLSGPSIPRAMNRALLAARHEIVLFVDDDVRPEPQLLAAHLNAHRSSGAALVAGRVIQPWQEGVDFSTDTELHFAALRPGWLAEFIGCNFSVRRDVALYLGGFDENFVRVAYRFEAEFAYRLGRSDHRIYFEPAACLHHLKVTAGGTRSFGEHLTTFKPDHAVGAYYYCLRTWNGWPSLGRFLGLAPRSVVTRHHLRQPWWVPVTLLAQLFGMAWALALYLRGPRYLRIPHPATRHRSADCRSSTLRDHTPIRVAIVATHPIQYQIPWFQRLAERPELDLKVFFGLLPDAAQQGVGFGVGFQWDIPLLDGYRWELLTNVAKTPSLGQFNGCDTPDIGQALSGWRPDVVILTGWHSRMLLQAWWACRRLGIARIVRGESNHLAPRAAWKRFAHRLWLRGFNQFLAIGQANRKFYENAGITQDRIHDCPYFIDNQRFIAAAADLHKHRADLRRDWGIPADATCFLFSGKLISKKHPLDLLRALDLATPRGACMHVLLAGAGELMGAARELAERERLPVTFAGFLNQSELARAYVAADCLVLPSDVGETWGLVVNEAMVCGLPAIVSDQVGCGLDLIIEGQTGAIFPTGDVAALADRLVEFAGDSQRLRAMGERARQRVLADYSVERAVDGTLTALRNAVGRPD